MTVALHLQDGTLNLEIIDLGQGGTAPGTVGGHGLIGMRERAGVFGGTVDIEDGEHGFAPSSTHSRT